MAFQGVQEGDVVTIWKDFPCPMILRAHEVDGREAWPFHSCAYVHGIMHGEAWPESEEQLEEFDIY